MMSGNRHSPEYWRKRREEGKVTPPPPVEFVAVDGEGTQEEVQHYSLLSSSRHHPITNRAGLSTEECLDYLLSLKTDDRQQLVGFGFNYDVNMILQDLRLFSKEELYEEETCFFEGSTYDYRISLVKGKTFTIGQYSKRKVYHERTEKLKSVIIWDVWGFFQGSLIKAVEEYKIPMTGEERELLEKGKAGRGTFEWEQDLGWMIEYNHLECDLTVKLMNEVQTMLRAQGIYLSRWDGAGAIAAALMRKNGVKEHVRQDYPQEIQEAMLRAYFGGRSQCVRFGHFTEPTYHYDLNSAYPSSYLDLPTLHGEWTVASRYLPNEKYVLYQLEWDIPYSEPITPFPYRLKDDSITYPHQGRGVYHSLLVDVAMKRWKRYIKIEKAYVFHPATDVKPFDWVQDFMTERLRLKKAGDLRHITMKLGANSIYGKTAQAIGFKDKIPPYQNYFWAGRVTAYSHAKLLEAAIQKPASVLFFATDAIFTSEPLNLPIGNTLGTWEDAGIIDRFELYQPGLYRMICCEEESDDIQGKTRGFRKEEIDFDELGRLWELKKYGAIYTATVTRFQGLQITQAQNRPWEWGTWKEFTKEVKLRPGGFGIPEGDGVSYTSTGNAPNFRFQFIDGGKELSAPFTKKDMLLPEAQLEIDLAEYEYLDQLETPGVGEID